MKQKSEVKKKQEKKHVLTSFFSTCWFDVDILIHVNQTNGGQGVEVPQTQFYERTGETTITLNYNSAWSVGVMRTITPKPQRGEDRHD